MKGREGKGPPSTDLLVCFPSRAHLTLMPKPICSPARPQEPNKRHHQHHLKKSIKNRSHKGLASPVPWAKNRAYGGKEIDEPTSPRITCAGQIKVKPKASSCKNWQSVMEEIERMHNHRKSKKRPSWAEALGFKKDVMQFLTCLRSLRFDFRCFGAFPSTSITSDDDEDEEDDEEYDEFHSQNPNQTQNQKCKEATTTEDLDCEESSRTVFSKWFMVLQEGSSANNMDINRMIRNKFSHGREEEDDDDQPSAPPPNALLLMRCRSAPAKSWLELKQEEQEEEDDDDDEHEEILQKLKREEEEEEKKKKENLIVMRCGTDFNKFSSDIAKETWVVGGIKEVLSRSRSWKR